MLAWARDDRTLVLLEAKDERDLDFWEDLIKAEGWTCESFCEEDLNNEKTAVGAGPVIDGSLLKKLKLLR